ERGRRGRELGAEVEELALQAPQHDVELAARGRALELRGVEGPRHPDGRVELVDRAVGLDPEPILRGALAADEIGLAFVAAPRVDARDPDRHGSIPTVARRGLSTRGAG